MERKDRRSEQPTHDRRLKLGLVLFVLSIALPIVGVAAVTALGFSVQVTAAVSGVLLVGAELLGIIAVAVMGKSGYVYIKQNTLAKLKKYGPPGQVGRRRYSFGLVLFCIPVLFGWLSPYAVGLIPGLTHVPLLWALGGDVLLLVSLFVLGGDFWDKVRALFIHKAEVRFGGEGEGMPVER